MTDRAAVMTDPLEGTAWSEAGTVAGFARSLPNAALMEFAQAELARLAGAGRALDLGCGAGRNAVPLTLAGWEVFGMDLSWPMLAAAHRRVRDRQLTGRLHLALAPMVGIPARRDRFDLVIAHGIWNLARSGAEFRQALREAAAVAKNDAALFVVTFSRNTLPPEAQPVPGESFVFTQFSGQPQCFLTEDQLVSELAAAGWAPDSDIPVRELNRPRPRALTHGAPVLYEGLFRQHRCCSGVEGG